MDEEKIKKQAKEIMDDFMKQLNKMEDRESEFGVERIENLREGKEKPKNEKFKKVMLRNAPKVRDEQIQAEKKKW